MKLDDSALQIIQHLDREFVVPYHLYRGNVFEFSKATFYRKLEALKQAGLIEWEVGKVKLTEKGLKLRSILNGSEIDFEEVAAHEKGKKEAEEKREKEEGRCFKLFEADRLRAHSGRFIYVDYPTASYILRALMLVAGIEEKGLKTNVEKFKALKNAEFKVKLAINHFENASKQVLVFLEELIKLGKIEALYVGVQNERKALSNKKLVEFLQDHDFENERFKLPKESVTLFPLFLNAVIGIILILALRSGYQHASILSVLIIVYFMRSMLFKELKGL